MKKTLIGILASLGCLACLAGCGGNNNGNTDGLQSAKDYVKEMYKEMAVETGADYDRIGKLPIDGVEYTIVWSVDVESGVTVTVEKDGNYLIDVDENASESINYVLTATITSPDGKTETLTFNHTVPKFRELTWAEFTATEDEKSVVVKGVITGIVNTSKKHELYFQDNDGGYYVYNLDAAQMEGLQVGQEIRVRGTRDTYYGVNQIIDASVETLNATPVEVTPLDITDAFKSATTLGDAALTSKQSVVVTIKGVTVLGQDAGDTTYYNFKLGDLTSYVRISSSACMFDSNDQKAFEETVATNKGKAADVTGVISIYNNKIYLIPLTKDAFSNFTTLELTDAEKIDFEIDLMTALDSTISKDVTLQTAGSVYSDVAISWVSNNETVAKVESGKLVITRPSSDAEDVEVTVTATISCGDATAKTVEYTFVVPKELSTLPLAISEAPTVGETYKFYLEQSNLDKTLYFAGFMDSYYYATTESQEEAADVTVEDAGEGKFYLSCDEGYLTISPYTKDDGSTSYNLSLTRDATTKFIWDETNKTVITEDGKAYIGTYKTFETFSASSTSYIGTSFPAKLCKLVDKSEIPEVSVPTTPEEILNALYALADGESLTGPFTLTGKITELDSYNNPTIVVEGFEDKPVYCYRLKVTNAVGDTITVTAGSMKNYKGTYEFMDCTLVTEDQGGTEEPPVDTPVEGTVTISIADVATENNWVDSTLYESVTYKNVSFTMAGTPVANYGLNTGKYYNSNKSWRVYQNEGGTLTVTAEAGKTIASVKITYSNKNNGVMVFNDEQIASGTSITVNANSFSITVAQTTVTEKANGNIQITSIEIVYAE